jgi:hypothetical protein
MAISSHTKWLRFANLLFGILILILSGTAFTKICSPPNHIQRKFNIEILDNWKNLSIYDLKAVSSQESCPFGYEEIAMATQWPGTYQGCYCSSKPIIQGSCTPDQINQHCLNIAPTISFSMTTWRGQILCILRQGTSAYWAPSPEYTGCPSKTDIYGNVVEFVQCGIGDKAICQESTIGCPINKIIIQQSSDPAPANYNQMVYFGDNYNLYYYIGNASSTDLPIIDLAISEGMVCLQDPGQEGNTSKTYYTLLESVPKGCDYYDGRFQILDTLNETEFYYNNNLQNITELPQFTLSPDNMYYLSARTTILWKSVCKGGYYSMETLNNNKDPLKYILNIHISLLVIQSLVAAYLILVDPLLLYFCYKRSEEEINEYDQPLYSILIIEKFLKIIMIPIMLGTCILVGYYRNWFSNLDARCCSDPTTNASFEFVDFILDDLYKIDWANFSIIIVTLIIDLISGLCLFVSRTKENFSL